MKVRWKLFNDLPEFKPSDNVVPDRYGKLAIIHNEQGNEGRLMYWALIPSFAEGMELPHSTINARDEPLAQESHLQPFAQQSPLPYSDHRLLRGTGTKAAEDTVFYRLLCYRLCVR